MKIQFIKQFNNILIFSYSCLFLAIIFGGLSQELNYRFLHVTHQLLIGLAAISLIFGLLIHNTYLRIHIFPKVFLMVAMILLCFQIIIGLKLQTIQSQYWIAGVHYGLSVIILGLIVSLLTYLFITKLDEPVDVNFSSSFSKQAVISVFLGIIVIVSGIYVSISGVRDACLSWPLCEGSIVPQNINGWVVLGHRLVVAGVGFYLIWFNRQAWRKQKSQRMILSMSNLFVVLYFAQGFVGALKTIQDFPLYMLILHETTAVLLVSVGFILLASVGVMGRSEEEEVQDSMAQIDRHQRWKDLIALNKPVVVLLLVATTIAGMIIGAGKLPDLKLLMITIISGFLAAGGSSAINQYIDRNLDGLMTRTANRPIPSGRLTPAEGLAFGISALVISFYLLAGFVNILSALLALVGMIYYVFIYSMFLKKRSVQNIVFGGGAGAIPPLVGWAASTGSLNAAAGFLFIIIFLWTPPHFWALALLRTKEYAAAGVPMMPVEKGEETTKRLIFQYTIVLVFTTLTLWLFGLAGQIYLAGAIILGAYLLYLAKQVLVNGRNRTYYRMYRHSNYYLLFLFIALAVDSVLR